MMEFIDDLTERHEEAWRAFYTDTVERGGLTTDDLRELNELADRIYAIPPTIFLNPKEVIEGMYFMWCLGALSSEGKYPQIFARDYLSKAFLEYWIVRINNTSDPSALHQELAMQKMSFGPGHAFYDATCQALDYCKDTLASLQYGSAEYVQANAKGHKNGEDTMEVKAVALIQYYLIESREVAYTKLTRGPVCENIARKFGLAGGKSLYNWYRFWMSPANRLYSTGNTVSSNKRREHFDTCINYLASNNFTKAHKLAVAEYGHMQD